MNEQIIDLEFEHFTKLYWGKIELGSPEDLEYRNKIKELKEKERILETQKQQKCWSTFGRTFWMMTHLSILL